MRRVPRLREIGETGLIERIARRAGPVRPGGPVVLGIGDDAALLRTRAGEDVVVSSDAMVEDVHFRWAQESPVDVGRRALVANLSDLAAMGARPLGFTLSLAAPPDLPVARLDGLAAGLARESAAHGCPWVGGNLARARETSISITVVGAVTRGRALRRGDVRAGDRLYVTGTLGGQALARLQAERRGGRLRRVPVPRLEAGRALGRLRQRGGCIDVSDGLAADLGNLLRGTRLGADLEAEKVPRPRGFDAACGRLGVSPRDLALGGGEDYELLFSVRPDAPGTAALSRRLGVPVTEVGRIGRRPGIRGLAGAAGWRHF